MLCDACDNFELTQVYISYNVTSMQIYKIHETLLILCVTHVTLFTRVTLLIRVTLLTQVIGCDACDRM